MGRPKKTETATVEEQKVDATPEVRDENPTSESQPETETTTVGETEEVKVTTVKDDKTDEISPRDTELMRLYPQYEEIWITPDGFVHPKGASAFLLKGAKLYKNKFYNK